MQTEIHSLRDEVSMLRQAMLILEEKYDLSLEISKKKINIKRNPKGKIIDFLKVD